jgi:hypothetical protein
MRWIAVVAVAACALVASLYATAAPEKRGPTNALLSAQIASLRTQVRTLKADVSFLTGRIRSLDDCQLRQLWLNQTVVYFDIAELYYTGSLSLPPQQPPKRPDCL